MTRRGAFVLLHGVASNRTRWSEFVAATTPRSAFTDLQRTKAWLARIADCETLTRPARIWIPTEQPEAMRAAIEAWVARRFSSGA